MSCVLQYGEMCRNTDHKDEHSGHTIARITVRKYSPMSIPHMDHIANVESMLGQRLRRWPNIDSTFSFDSRVGIGRSRVYGVPVCVVYSSAFKP